MATLREVRSRIVGVKKTQKITKAMKMVAAAKLRQAQQNVVSARPYARKLGELLRHLREQVPAGRSILLDGHEVRTVAIIVVTADRGLCGAFNSNLIRTTQQTIATKYAGWLDEGRVRLFCVGKKGVDFFGKRGYRLEGRYPGAFARLAFGTAQEIVREVVNGYTAGTYDRVEIIYNEFKSTSQQRIVTEQFLPVGRDATAAGKARQADYIYEPGQEALLHARLPRHLNFQIWRVLLESNAAELGARMTAMENATRNADEMIEALQLQYNKARQAAITKELLEVVSGAEALSQAN
jgi:F-type H+-transporting ATPase subunit gamma